jgi:hypothetical protein
LREAFEYYFQRNQRTKRLRAWLEVSRTVSGEGVGGLATEEHHGAGVVWSSGGGREVGDTESSNRMRTDGRAGTSDK